MPNHTRYNVGYDFARLSNARSSLLGSVQLFRQGRRVSLLSLDELHSIVSAQEPLSLVYQNDQTTDIVGTRSEADAPDTYVAWCCSAENLSQFDIAGYRQRTGTCPGSQATLVGQGTVVDNRSYANSAAVAPAPVFHAKQQSAVNEDTTDVLQLASHSSA